MEHGRRKGSATNIGNGIRQRTLETLSAGLQGSPARQAPTLQVVKRAEAGLDSNEQLETLEHHQPQPASA